MRLYMCIFKAIQWRVNANIYKNGIAVGANCIAIVLLLSKLSSRKFPYKHSETPPLQWITMYLCSDLRMLSYVHIYYCTRL